MSALNDPKRPSREQILRLTKQGKTPREIAGQLDLSVQRVYQQLARLRDLGLLEEAS